MGMGSAAGPAECAPSGVSSRSASPKPNETTEGGDSSRLGASLASLRRRRGAPGATGATGAPSSGSGGSSGSDPDSRSPSPPPPGASTPVHGFLRARARSFGSLLHDATRGGVMTTLEGVSRRFATTLERELGRHLGPAGAGVVEMYRFAWRRFNRRVVFHIVFYSILGAILFALWALVAYNLWRLVGQWILRRVVWVVGAVLVLAALPPSFPNAAAHALSLALVAAELVLLNINLALFALVHLAVWLNKYILPHWFHRGRAFVAEIGGVSGEGLRARERANMARERNRLLVALDKSDGYGEYLACVAKLDDLPADLGEGGSAWREDDELGGDDVSYDADLCRIYIGALRDARGRGDRRALGLALRTVLHRNFAGVDRLARLRGARCGTKRTAEAFVKELVASVRFLSGERAADADADADAAAAGEKGEKGTGKEGEAAAAAGRGAFKTRGVPSGGVPARLPPSSPPAFDVSETLRLVSEAHRSLGRTALCLSGGGALAMYHFGVIKVLLEEGLLPQVVSGTSGGSIVAAFISMFPEEELLRTIRPDLSNRHGVRWFPPVWKMIIHFVQSGTLMDKEEFARTTEAYFGDVTFAEAFVRSKRAVSIQISVGSGHGFVLNHFTAPQVLIRTAVNASCALPGLMEPTALLAKDEATGELTSFHPPGVSAFDGTITADIPSARLTELFNCNNFVVSQVNPHVNFVLHLAEEGTGRRGSGRRGRSYDRRAAVTKLLRVANFLLLNIKYGAQKLLEVDLLNLRMVRTLQGILVQDFRGHITVLPELRVKDYVRVLQQPSAEDMAAFIAAGERATWPHVEAIRLATAPEIALQEAAARLRAEARRTNTANNTPGVGHRAKNTVGDGFGATARAANAGAVDAANANGSGASFAAREKEKNSGRRDPDPSGGGSSSSARGDGGLEGGFDEGWAPRTGGDEDVAAHADSEPDPDPREDPATRRSVEKKAREDATHAEHLGAGLSCAVEPTTWH